MNKNLPIYGVPGQIGHYQTTKKDARKGIEKLPPLEFLLTEEDMFSPINIE